MRNTWNRRKLIPTILLAALLLAAAPWNSQVSAQAAPAEEGTVADAPSNGPVETTPENPTTGVPETTIPEPLEPVPVPVTPRAWRKIVVDLSEQELNIFDQYGRVVHTWKISSGAPKTPTPVGRYRITSKSRRTFATKNPDVTMEHMVRFKGGIGFHSIPRLNGTPLGTPLGERGVSHGCIRLADVNARMLYRNLPVGAVVIVKP
jgi:lipoprotein-anchoring transpeptidase ErfK/SrfK